MINVKVVVLGSVVNVELPNGSNLNDVVREARVPAELVAQHRGSTVQRGDFGRTTVRNGETVVFTPPALKHGR